MRPQSPPPYIPGAPAVLEGGTEEEEKRPETDDAPSRGGDVPYSCDCGASRIEFCYCDLKAAFEKGLALSGEEDSDNSAVDSAPEDEEGDTVVLPGEDADGTGEIVGVELTKAEWWRRKKNPFRSAAAKRPFCYCGAARQRFCHCSVATTFQVIPTGGLAVRSSPHAEIGEANVVGRLACGDVVRVTRVEKQWVRHTFEGAPGWSIRRRGVHVLLRPLGSTTSVDALICGNASGNDVLGPSGAEDADAMWASLDLDAEVQFEHVAAAIACSFARKAADAAIAAAASVVDEADRAKQILRGRYARRIAIARVDVAAKTAAHAAAAAACAAADDAVFSKRVAETRAPLLRSCRAFARWKASVRAVDGVEELVLARASAGRRPPIELPASTAERLVARAAALFSARCDALFFASRRARGNAVRRRRRVVTGTAQRVAPPVGKAPPPGSTGSAPSPSASLLKATLSSGLGAASAASPRRSLPTPIATRTRLLKATASSVTRQHDAVSQRGRARSPRAQQQTTPARKSSLRGEGACKLAQRRTKAASGALSAALAAARFADRVAFKASAVAGSAAVSQWHSRRSCASAIARASSCAAAAAKRARTVARDASMHARRVALDRANAEQRFLGGDALDESLWDLV